MIYNITMNNDKSRLGFFCSEKERLSIIDFLLDYYTKKKYKIYNYNLCLNNTKHIDNKFNITKYPKLKKNEIIFAKIFRPLDYLIFNKNINKEDNLICFLKGPNFYLPSNFYDYLIFEANLRYNKIKIQKVYRNLFEKSDGFDEWWNKIDKYWLIIDVENKIYFKTDDLFEIFQMKKNDIDTKFSFSDYLFDIL